MFTIDLLKEQGVPMKSRPEGIAITAVAFVVPLIIAIIMFGCYLHTKIIVSIQKQGIVNYEKRIRQLSDAVEIQRSFENKRSIINNCLLEVASSLGRHSQWSPVLVTLVRDMPDSVALTSLDLKQRSVRKKMPSKSNPNQMVDVAVPVRTLQMTVSGHPNYNHSRAVRDFADRLRFSDVLEPKLEEIRVSQEGVTLQGEDVVSYGIDCIFKPAL